MSTNVYFTSDLWLGRENILKIANRPYESLEEMENDIIEKWNSIIKDDDTVYVLNNFAVDPYTAARALKDLNGNIILMNPNSALTYAFTGDGNKDNIDLDELISSDGKIVCTSQTIIEDASNDVVICYWPMSEWNGKESGTLHIYGYSYPIMKGKKGNMTDIAVEDEITTGRINVCMDKWNFYPVSLKAIKSYIRNEKKIRKQNNATEKLSTISD